MSEKQSGHLEMRIRRGIRQKIQRIFDPTCLFRFVWKNKLHLTSESFRNHEAGEKNMVLQTKLLVRCARLQDAKNLSEELNAADLRCARALSTNNRSIWTSSANFIEGGLIEGMQWSIGRWTYQRFAKYVEEQAALQYHAISRSTLHFILMTTQHCDALQAHDSCNQKSVGLWTFHSHFMIYSSLERASNLTDSSHQIWSPNLQVVLLEFRLHAIQRWMPCFPTGPWDPWAQGRDDMTKQDTTLIDTVVYIWNNFNNINNMYTKNNM